MRAHITIIDDNGNQYAGDATLVKVTKQKVTQLKIKKGSKPSDAVKGLYFDNYFKEERKLLDVTLVLSKKGYNFNRDSIYKALELANFLNKKGNRGSYRFVQKYPPSQ